MRFFLGLFFILQLCGPFVYAKPLDFSACNNKQQIDRIVQGVAVELYQAASHGVIPSSCISQFLDQTGNFVSYAVESCEEAQIEFFKLSGDLSVYLSQKIAEGLSFVSCEQLTNDVLDVYTGKNN